MLTLKWLKLITVLSLGLCIAGCGFSLAQDVTPPPGSYNSQTVPAETPSLPTGGVTATPVSGTTSATQDPANAKPSTIRVTGNLINLSGTAIPSQLMVTLHGIDNTQETLTLTSQVSDNGTYSFDRVEMVPERIFIATVELDGMTYSSDLSNHTGTTSYSPATGNALSLPIKIYGVSNNPTLLTIDRLHIYFTFGSDGKVQVVEMLLISNPTQTIIAPVKNQALFHINLPYGATATQFMDANGTVGVTQTDQGLDYKKSVLPGKGTSQVIFSYELPYQDQLEYSQSFPMPIQTTNVMIPTTGIKLDGGHFTDSGMRTTEGMNFHLYTTESLPSGMPIHFHLSGKSQSPASGNLSGTSTPILAGVGMLAVSLTTLGFLLVKQKRLREAEKSQPIGMKVDPDQTSLVEAIIALDDLYKAKKLSEPVYHQRRGALKAQLKEVIDQSKQE